jgi:hypothetical protein
LIGKDILLGNGGGAERPRRNRFRHVLPGEQALVRTAIYIVLSAFLNFSAGCTYYKSVAMLEFPFEDMPGRLFSEIHTGTQNPQSYSPRKWEYQYWLANKRFAVVLWEDDYWYLSDILVTDSTLNAYAEVVPDLMEGVDTRTRKFDKNYYPSGTTESPILRLVVFDVSSLDFDSLGYVTIRFDQVERVRINYPDGGKSLGNGLLIGTALLVVTAVVVAIEVLLGGDEEEEP